MAIQNKIISFWKQVKLKSSDMFTQFRVGVGVKVPTHKLHVKDSKDPVKIEGLQNDATDPDKFLTIDSSNIVKYRTGAQVLTDIGGTPLTTEQVQDIAGALVATGGTKTGIAITYDDDNGDIDFVVDHDAATNFVAEEHYRWDNDIQSTATINHLNLSSDTPGETEVLVINDGDAVWGHGEKIHIQVRNDEGSTISAGQPLYSKGEIGGSNRILVGVCDANDSAKMPCIGIAYSEMNTTSTKDNFAVVSGIYNTNISGFTSLAVGDNLYTQDNGSLSQTKPAGEASLIQNVAIVLRTNGSICQGMLVSAIGRTNDVPNLNSGYIFYGNGSNQAVSTQLSTLLPPDLTVDGERTIHANNVPTLNQDTTGNASTATNAQGITGATDADVEITSDGEVTIKLDSDNDETNQKFKVVNNSGTEKFSITENGVATFTGNITVNEKITNTGTDNDLTLESDGSMTFTIDRDNDETSQSFSFKNYNVEVANLDESGNLQIDGNLTLDGTVDGRDVAADGTKLDGIESGATADQTKGDIDALGIAATTAVSLTAGDKIIDGNLGLGGDDADSHYITRVAHSDDYGGRLYVQAGTGGGTNKPGGSLRLQGGASTGSAAGGSVIFTSSAAGSSGSSVNSVGILGSINSEGNLSIEGDLTVKGNDIKDDDGTTCITFDSSGNTTVSNTLNATLTGNVTGNTSGSSGSCTGNAATATALATARAINGVDFDGSAAITVTAAGSTLSDTVTVAKGGTGQTTLTSDSVLTGNGTSGITAESNLTYDGTNLKITDSGLGAPDIIIESTSDHSSAGNLIFQKLRADDTPADGGNLGAISFSGEDTSNNTQIYGQIVGIQEETGAGTEGGKIKIVVATHDGELQDGIVIEDGDAEDEVDVTIGQGANSLTTIAGNLTTVGGIELGNASDTTLARSAAGTVTIEEKEIITKNKVLNIHSYAYHYSGTLGHYIPMSGATTSDSTGITSSSYHLMQVMPFDGRVVRIAVYNQSATSRTDKFEMYIDGDDSDLVGDQRGTDLSFTSAQTGSGDCATDWTFSKEEAIAIRRTPSAAVNGTTVTVVFEFDMTT